jgi:hypothetical protein
MNVLGIVDVVDGMLRVHVETRVSVATKKSPVMAR